MTRGGYRAGKSSSRSKTTNRAKLPSIPTPMIEQDDTSSIPTIMPTDQTPIIPETSLISPNQSNPTSQNMNAQINRAVEVIFGQRNVSASSDSSCNNSRTPIFLTSSGFIPTTYVFTVFVFTIFVHKYCTVLLVLDLMLYRLKPSSKCSSFITLSFKSEVDPNGINWKGVLQDVKDDYFGEFKDASVSEVVVKQQWMKKPALCYKN
ncbi:uncharacterized protein LOC124888166 [Capsicum annuum]|uniref:uncharacterized protein LOC124888166 n=1 Tax=Capsicum annuum TaxID=4072 RepID=UPI001FB06C34|nr:uncharacterized protein LOC124888166 [Capsicum annuum]